MTAPRVTPSNARPAPAQGGAASQVSTDLKRVPIASPQDAPLRGAFQVLDGHWEGTFRVYLDTRGQQPGPRQVLTRDVLDEAPYRLETTIRVQQHYVSESPRFQRVTIRDRWTSGGRDHDVTSLGLNKVEAGALWCVVHKPDDVVLHRGVLVSSDTIVWTRDRQSPLAIEHFEEQVAKHRYTIRGWGYYGADDPKLAPRLYFDAIYTRPKE